MRSDRLGETLLPKKLALPVLLPELVPALLAEVFSTMLIVSRSPIWRARRSSNIGR